MYLVEVLVALDDFLIEARGIEDEFSIGEYYPEFTGVVSGLKPDLSNLSDVLESLTKGYVGFDDDIFDLIKSNVGSFVVFEDNYSKMVKLRIIKAEDADVCFVVSPEMFEVVSFNATMNSHVGSVLNGDFVVTEFSRDTADYFVSHMLDFFAVPAVLEDGRYLFDFTHVQSLANPAYKVLVDCKVATVMSRSTNLKSALDKVYDSLLSKFDDKRFAETVIKEIDKSLRSVFGHYTFKRTEVKVFVEGVEFTCLLSPLSLRELISD